jgi:hypothetical protein
MPETQQDSPRTPAEVLLDTYRLSNLAINPQPVRVYKPRQGGGGAALKLQLRLEPTIKRSDSGAEFIDEVDGGLFVELAAQEGEVRSGAKQFPAFGWASPSLVRAKLGMPDITGLLVAFREVRLRGRPVPVSLQPKQASEKSAQQVGMFHKFGQSSTALTYTFEPDGSSLYVSKSKDLRRSITLSLSEELLVESYLRLALDAFVRVGQR